MLSKERDQSSSKIIPDPGSAFGKFIDPLKSATIAVMQLTLRMDMPVKFDLFLEFKRFECFFKYYMHLVVVTFESFRFPEFFCDTIIFRI